MNTKATVLLLFLFIANSYSQEPYKKLPFAKNKCATTIIGNDIIANESIIETEDSSITEISVLKYKGHEEVQDLYNLTEHGMVFIRMTKKLEVKTQKELNQFFGLPTTNEIYVDGYLLEKQKFKIAVDCIVEIELVEPNLENQLKSKTINVWTLNKEGRLKGCYSNN
ncbi:hypothetical protein LV716_03640 [Flagellimonas sp. HMM57]|uniref:hypothetical protein n=1 Tax=unclassified Flagellimonas TaxID=2644544 RepID=UPI0013D7F090|nr:MULTISPECIES: hypothetical protein [unclassified Flagellimonas]UII76893.1 hypothetical protein LV716_03640 [Flagellimonas sp. HMM57]